MRPSSASSITALHRNEDDVIVYPSQNVKSQARVGLFLLWGIVTLYNLFKPYHIDDTVHLEIARWIGGHPFHPMAGLLNWSGIDEPIYKTNQPHLYFYVIAIWGGLFGYGEIAMHTLQALAALACILLFYRLACTLVRPVALWTTATLVLGPAFIVEQNSMVDVPLLAIWLAFFNLLICDIGSPNQTRRYALAALTCAAALLIKYSSLTLLIILCLSLLLERRKAQAWTVLIPLVVLVAWSLFNFLDYGGIHIATRSPGESRGRLWMVKEVVAWILALGALTPFGIIAGNQFCKKSAGLQEAFLYIILAAFGILVLTVGYGMLSDRQADRLLWVVFIVNGAVTCLALVPDILRVIFSGVLQPERARALGPIIYLLLWIIGTSAFYVMFAPFTAARHILLILPALTLCLTVGWKASLTRTSKVFGLAITVIVSVGLGLCDWQFANFYRLEAVKLAQAFPEESTVWTGGHWGWQWYAAQSGFREVDVHSSRLKAGDYLVIADNVDHQSLEAPPPMHVVRTDVQENPSLSIFYTGRDARFYKSDYRDAPWSLSLNCINQLTVFQFEGNN